MPIIYIIRGQKHSEIPAGNSQDFKLRMLIKCGSGDNTLKGHNYNYIIYDQGDKINVIEMYLILDTYYIIEQL